MSVPSANIKNIGKQFPIFLGYAIYLVVAISQTPFPLHSQHFHSNIRLFVLTRVYLSTPLSRFSRKWIEWHRMDGMDMWMNFDFRTICALFTLDYVSNCLLINFEMAFGGKNNRCVY